MAASLDDTWARVEWAHRHLSTLVSALNAFMEQPFNVRSELAPDGRQRIDIAEPKPVPIDISLMLGDVVHALRSSLDYLVCSLAESTGQAVTTAHEFPVNKNVRSDFEARRSRTLAGVPRPAVDLIEQLQPYGDNTNKLALLHSADVIDKHRAILVANVTIDPVRVTGNEPDAPRFADVFLRGPNRSIISIVHIDEGTSALSAYHSHVMLNEPSLPNMSVDGFAADLYNFVAADVLPRFESLGLLRLTNERGLPAVDLVWHTSLADLP